MKNRALIPTLLLGVSLIMLGGYGIAAVSKETFMAIHGWLEILIVGLLATAIVSACSSKRT